MAQRKERSRTIDMKELAGPLRLLLTVGWYVALSLMVPVSIGYWLDRPQMFNRAPLFTFIGLGVGTFIAFAGLIRILLRYRAEQEEVRKAEEKQDKRP
jgi:F0F1-type ATP synthase assembly protein I